MANLKYLTSGSAEDTEFYDFVAVRGLNGDLVVWDPSWNPKIFQGKQWWRVRGASSEVVLLNLHPTPRKMSPLPLLSISFTHFYDNFGRESGREWHNPADTRCVPLPEAGERGRDLSWVHIPTKPNQNSSKTPPGVNLSVFFITTTWVLGAQRNIQELNFWKVPSQARWISDSLALSCLDGAKLVLHCWKILNPSAQGVLCLLCLELWAGRKQK